MQRKYVMALVGVTLGLVFFGGIYLSTQRKIIPVEPIESFNQKQKITFISSWGAYDSKAMILKDILQNLSEKYTNVEIEDSSMAGEDFIYILKTDFASGNEPDLFGLWPGTDFDLLVETGKVADLTELVKSDPKWYKQFKKDTWEYVTVDERIYGLPIEIIYEGLFINKDLFDKYNIKIPSDFNELLNAVEGFKRVGIIPIAYSETPEGSYIYQNIVMKLGGKEEVENPFNEDGKIKPCFVEGMKYMKQLYDIGAFPEKLWSINDKTRNEMFYNKKAAMIVQGSWMIGEDTLSGEDKTIEVIPFPDMPGGKAHSSAIIYGCGNGIFHISQKAWDNPKIRESCSLLLKEFTSPKNVSLLLEDTGFISNVELGEYEPETSILKDKGDLMIKQSEELIGPVDSFINRGIWENVIVKKFPAVLKGSITAETLCKEVEKLNNEIKEE